MARESIYQRILAAAQAERDRRMLKRLEEQRRLAEHLEAERQAMREADERIEDEAATRLSERRRASRVASGLPVR